MFESWIEQFYKYDKLRGSNKYVGYHTHTPSPFDVTGEGSIFEQGIDDSRPFFLFNGKDEPWCNESILGTKQGLVLEIGMKVQASEIYLARDGDDYAELLRLPYGGGHYQYSEFGQDLINQGKRWFILANHPRGENESFLGLANEVVLTMNILQSGLQGGQSACPLLFRM